MFFTDCDIDTGAHHYITFVKDARFRDKPIIQMTKSIRRGPLDLTTIWLAKLRQAPLSLRTRAGYIQQAFPKKPIVI